MDNRSTSNVIRLDAYRRLSSYSGVNASGINDSGAEGLEGDHTDAEDLDLCDAYGRTIADWIWAELFDAASGEDDKDETRHCEVIYWQFAAGAGRR